MRILSSFDFNIDWNTRVLKKEGEENIGTFAKLKERFTMKAPVPA